MRKLKDYGYKVEFDSEVTFNKFSREPYGDWHMVSEHRLGDVKICNDSYPDIASSIEINPNETCFVVWATRSDGDSFGCHECANAEAFGIFKDHKSANELKNMLESFGSETKSSLKCSTSDGQDFNFSCIPWHGYFEYLNSVTITEIKVSE